MNSGGREILFNDAHAAGLNHLMSVGVEKNKNLRLWQLLKCLLFNYLEDEN
jgi:hypothetical protein